MGKPNPDYERAREAIWTKLNPDTIGEDGRHQYNVRLLPDTLIRLYLLSERRGASMTETIETAIENELQADNRWGNRFRRWAIKKLTPSSQPKR